MRGKASHLFLRRCARKAIRHVTDDSSVGEKLTEENIKLAHIEPKALIYFVNGHTRVSQYAEIYEIAVGVIMIKIIRLKSMIHRSLYLRVGQKLEKEGKILLCAEPSEKAYGYSTPELI